VIRRPFLSRCGIRNFVFFCFHPLFFHTSRTHRTTPDRTQWRFLYAWYSGYLLCTQYYRVNVTRIYYRHCTQTLRARGRPARVYTVAVCAFIRTVRQTTCGRSGRIIVLTIIVEISVSRRATKTERKKNPRTIIVVDDFFSPSYSTQNSRPFVSTGRTRERNDTATSRSKRNNGALRADGNRYVITVRAHAVIKGPLKTHTVSVAGGPAAWERFPGDRDAGAKLGTRKSVRRIDLKEIACPRTFHAWPLKRHGCENSTTARQTRRTKSVGRTYCARVVIK